MNSQISELNGQISETETNLKQAEEDYEKQEKLMETRLIEIQEKGESSYLDFLLTKSNNLVDFISNYYFVQELVTTDIEFLESIKNKREEIQAAKEKLETSKKELDTAKASKQGISTQLKTAKNEKDKKVEELSEDEKSLQQQIEELKNHERSISNQIKKLQEEYDRKKREEAANKQQNSSSGSTGSSGQTNSNGATSSFGFGWPVKNNRIGTRFGEAGKWWSSGYHTGVDFPVPAGTPVFAVGDGQVVDTGYNRAYGNFVEIYHGSNVYSFYAHASSLRSSNGADGNKGTTNNVIWSYRKCFWGTFTF